MLEIRIELEDSGGINIATTTPMAQQNLVATLLEVARIMTLELEPPRQVPRSNLVIPRNSIPPVLTNI